MSTLYTRVADLYRSGHTRADVELHRDMRARPGNDALRPAAVLIAITERERPGVLLLHRPSNMRAHPGEIAFPGGKLDPGETPIEAALREAWEELGVNSRTVRVVGASDVYWSGSGFEITPVIGIVPPDIAIMPNPTEVAQWFEAPLDFVLDPANHERHWFEREGRKIDYWRIQWEDHKIWGVTAGILVNLSRRLRWHG